MKQIELKNIQNRNKKLLTESDLIYNFLINSTEI